ncbi:hypothetical protein [Microbacterium jejuense]|uniref:hypothetical protein n=1 Tax=Microbacterium jejuense TaxID=1263637 RepID=UPI0031E69F6A
MTLPSETPAAGDATSSAAASSGAASPGPAAPAPAEPEALATSAAAGEAVRNARLAWLIGGSLLIAYAVLVLTANGNAVLSFPGRGFVLEGLWAGALLVLAFGIRGRGSVVARRPLGVVALVIAAAVPLLSESWWALFPLGAWDSTTAVMVGNGTTLVTLGALIVATVVIGREGAVPDRIRWVPLIVLAVAAGAQIAMSIVGVTLASNLVLADVVAAYFYASMLGTLGVMLLGILAIVFAPREAPKPAPPTQVYPPAS